MPDVPIEIFVRGGPNFLPALLDTSDVRPGSKVILDDGSTITFEGADELRAADASAVIMLVLTIPPAVVDTALIVSWPIKHGPRREHVKTFTINRHIVEYGDEGEIRRVIDEAIEETR
jgi:hypothetical protein